MLNRWPRHRCFQRCLSRKEHSSSCAARKRSPLLPDWSERLPCTVMRPSKFGSSWMDYHWRSIRLEHIFWAPAVRSLLIEISIPIGVQSSWTTEERCSSAIKYQWPQRSHWLFSRLKHSTRWLPIYCGCAHCSKVRPFRKSSLWKGENTLVHV